MKIKNIQYLLVILFLSVLTPLFTQATTGYSCVNQQEETVYVTKTGTKYHKSTCGYLSRSSIKTSLLKAKEGGYTACSRCKGGTPTKTKATLSSRCSATTKAGTRCKRNSASGSSRCWQH